MSPVTAAHASSGQHADSAHGVGHGTGKGIRHGTAHAETHGENTRHVNAKLIFEFIDHIPEKLEIFRPLPPG